MSQHTFPVSSDRTEDAPHPASENREQQDVAGAIVTPSLNSDWSPKPLSERETVRRQMEAYSQARANQEEAQVEIATDKSLKDFENGSANDECQSSPLLMEECINNMATRLEKDLPVIRDPSGDTWVFVDPPAQPAQGDDNYAFYIRRYESPFLLQARFLLDLGSAYFERALSPTSQYRVLRRRGLAGKLPPTIKYVLDLTPPIEGDDAVYLTTELCCSQGVLSWSESTKRWGVSKTLVGGSEECSPQGPAPSHQSGTSHPADSEAHSIPLEYSQLRHWAAIERVLLAIQGQDPQLNSAPKVWTTFAVAKYFDINHSPLTDYIVRWLRAYPNSYFIEVLPEVSLKIADGLQCQQLCRDTFAILVGEEALVNVHRCRGGTPEIRHSVHGRKRDDLPELYQTRVEYGSKTFLDRITATFQELVGHEMGWMGDVPEYHKLASINQAGVTNSNVLVMLMDRLKAYVRGAIYKILCSNFEQMPNAENGIDGDDELDPRTTWTDIWNRLLPRERIMTRFFWRALRNQDIICGSCNFDINDHMANSTHSPDAEPTAIEESMLIEGAFEKVYKAELEDLALRLKALSIAHRVPRPGHKALSIAHRVLRLGHQSLPIRTTNLAISVARDDAIKSGDDVDSNHSNTVLKPTERSMIPGFHAQAEDCEVTSGPHSLASPHNATLLTDENYSTVCFKVGTFLDQVRAYVRPICDRMLGSSDIYSPLELELTNTLVCLEDTEFKYLPIWANGNDDGSGGVYNDEVPSAYGGFTTAGPDVHTGTGSSTASSDGYELVGSQSDNSTCNTSTIVNDGRSSVLHPGRTYAMSEGGESWDTVPAGNHGELTGLHAFLGNPPSTDTRATILASDDGMLESLAEVDIDEEAKVKRDVARMEHMGEMANATSESPIDRDMEEAVSNAFEEDDDDSSATELGDPFSDTEAIDAIMEDQEDQEYDSEDEDTIVV